MNSVQIRPFLAKKGILGPKKGSKVAQMHGSNLEPFVSSWLDKNVIWPQVRCHAHLLDFWFIGSLANKLSLWFQVKKFELVRVTPY